MPSRSGMVLVDLLKQFSIRQMTVIMGPRVRWDDGVSNAVAPYSAIRCAAFFVSFSVLSLGSPAMHRAMQEPP